MVTILWIISLVIVHGTKKFSFRTYTKEFDRISSGDCFEPRAVSSNGVDYTVLDKPHSLNFLDISF